MNRPALAGDGAGSQSGRPLRSAGVLLVRLAAGSAGEREVARDLGAALGQGRTAEGWRAEIQSLAPALQVAGLLERSATRLALTPMGRSAALAFLGLDDASELKDWDKVRDGALIIKALGLEAASSSRKKAAGRVDGLRALIVETVWKLSGSGRPSASRIRDGLAKIALQRAFGNHIKAGLGGKTALSGKAARLLAGQLAKQPKRHSTDARLIAQLASEAVDAPRADLKSLRQGVLRRFLDGEAAATGSLSKPVSGPDISRTPAPVSASPEPPRVAPPGPAGRPDPIGFARAIQAAAKAKAEGWSGSRRAYVSRVWEVVRDRHASWALSEIEFKCMLAEAHRMGLIALSTADLKDRNRLADVEASAVTYKNTVWHYVRVEE
jgi:hypothetical protein